MNLFRRAPAAPIETLDRFVDSLVQSFENCRSGLSDEELRAGTGTGLRFFEELYAKEGPRLADVVRLQEPHLSQAARDEYLKTLDGLIRKVVLPSYVRLALRFTERERNDFYLFAEPFHGLERAGWTALGILLGVGVVAAPFIPLWEKYWILPFAIGGLFGPNIRRYLALRSYENDLNEIVGRTNSEILRVDTAYLTSTEALQERGRSGTTAAHAAAARAKAEQGSRIS